jgi:hypothetical protein
VIGHWTWAIPEGFIPGASFSQGRELVSHEACCILNAGDTPANVELTLYFEDREPAGPYRVEVGPGRTRHLRYNDLEDPEPIPCDTAYTLLIRSDGPVVVQHSRQDSRDPHIAVLSTSALPILP